MDSAPEPPPLAPELLAGDGPLPATSRAEPPAVRTQLLSPKLADLFLLTFTGALFLTFCRYAFGSDVNFALWPLNDWETLGYGAGVACCWAGIYRMLRPGDGRGPLRPAEWQPGEMICLVEGCYYLVVAAMGAGLRLQLLDGMATVPEDDPNFEFTFNYGAVAALYLLPAMLMSIGYLVMATRVTLRAWRIAAVAKVVGHLGGAMVLVVQSMDMAGDYYEQFTLLLLTCFALPTLLVLIAAVRDRSRPGVHWLHWLGITAFTLIYASRLSLELRVWSEPIE